MEWCLVPYMAVTLYAGATNIYKKKKTLGTCSVWGPAVFYSLWYDWEWGPYQHTHPATAPTRSIKALRPCYFDLTLIHRVHNKCKYSNLALMHYHYFCHIFLPSPTPVSIIGNVLYYIVLVSLLYYCQSCWCGLNYFYHCIWTLTEAMIIVLFIMEVVHPKSEELKNHKRNFKKILMRMWHNHP